MGEKRFNHILNSIKNQSYNDINSLDLLKLIMNYNLNEQFFIENQRLLISLCTVNFNIYDYFSLRYLNKISSFHEDIEKLFNDTIKSVFSNCTQILLNRMFVRLTDNLLSVNDIFKYIMAECETLPTEKSSIILFELSIFNDFSAELQKRNPIAAVIIKAYMHYDNSIIGKNMFKGSSIIGKLVKNNNEKLVFPYVLELLGNKKMNTKNFKMVGGGGSSLVFEVNNQILKLGETRNKKKVFANHRILQSKVRDLISKNEIPLFFVEIMNPAIVGNVTEEERDELVKDLERQGIIWEDTKLENCGVLQDWDKNDSVKYEDIDHTLYIANIENPVYKLEFDKRKRRVVVIDNDDMRLKPGYCK